MRGYIYFIQPTSNNDGNKGIKIGCTKNFEHRLASRDYKKCIVIQVNYVSDYHAAEKELKKEFNTHFPLLEGTETFIVEDISLGLAIFNSVVKNFIITHENLEEDHTNTSKQLKEKAYKNFNGGFSNSSNSSDDVIVCDNCCDGNCGVDCDGDCDNVCDNLTLSANVKLPVNTAQSQKLQNHIIQTQTTQTQHQTTQTQQPQINQTQTTQTQQPQNIQNIVKTSKLPASFQQNQIIESKIKDFNENDIDIDFNNGDIKFCYENKIINARNLKDEKFDVFNPDGFRIHDNKLYVHKPGRKHGWYYIGPKRNSKLISQILSNPSTNITIMILEKSKKKGNLYVVQNC